MSTEIVKYAFVAGEISPSLYGRTDLTKFDLGMAEARNFFVDYRGGLSTRPGTQFMEHVKEDQLPTRMVPFAFSPDDQNTHILLFGHFYLRILHDGNYVLEDVQSCSTSGGVVTDSAHGLTNGRWIKAAGRTYEVANVTTDTFEILGVPSGAPASASFTSYRAIYEIASPYSSDQLADLNFHQYRDRMRITSLYRIARDLTRHGATDWSFAEVEISPFFLGPSITSHEASDTGKAQVIFAVTGVTEDGAESVIGAPYYISDIVNYPVTEGSVTISWQADPAFRHYNIYRSVVAGGETAPTLSLGSELGYVGRTRGTSFTDPNIVPDFGRVPPSNYNPFARGAITSVEITNGGSGYTTPPTVTASGGSGSGFVARAILDDAGRVVNILILNGGSLYTSPTISINGNGNGATATATATPTYGIYPSLSTIFQQRQIFAASLEHPITIWGSQPRRFDNFNSSDLVLDSDSFEFDLDSNAIAPIRFLLSTRGGLLAMTQDNIWLISGGEGNSPITPSSVLADPHTYTGVSNLEPIRIGAHILYTEGKGYAVRALAYNELSRVYAGEDRSILSAHLFGPGRKVTSWAFQESPYKVVWCVREDGALLAHTTVESEEVSAWTPCETRGRFTEVIAVREGTEDRVYVTVERFVQGRWTRFVERLDFRTFDFVEDAWCVDCGLALGETYPSGTLTLHREDDTFIARLDGGSWGNAVGKTLRTCGGLFEIVAAGNREATLHLRRRPTQWVPETDETISFPQPEGTWTLDTPFTEIGGLWHLEGETVSILADGNVIPKQQVVDGQITLPSPATRVIVGLAFTCRAKTLPLIVPDAGIEAKRKRIVAVAVRLSNSRALKVGDSYETVYEFPERTDETWGEPIALQDGIKQMPIGTTWDEESFTYFLLDDPLPATLLSLVQDVEVGDEPD